MQRDMKVVYTAMKVVSEVYTSWMGVTPHEEKKMGHDAKWECFGDAVELAPDRRQTGPTGRSSSLLRMDTDLSPEEFRRIFAVGAVIEDVDAWELDADDDRYKMFFVYRKVNEKWEVVRVYAETAENAMKLADPADPEPWNETDAYSEKVLATGHGTEMLPGVFVVKMQQRLFPPPPERFKE